METFEHGTPKQQENARLLVQEKLTQIAPIFTKQKYMLGEDFSILDIAVAPMLWRLAHYQIVLPKQAAPLLQYADRIFKRQAFMDSLTAAEKAMHK